MPSDTSFDRQLDTKADGRLDAPAFHRNIEPMLAVLRRVLAGRSGDVLEIGSGTGQHVTRYAAAFPALTWHPSDISRRNLESIEAWRRHDGLENLRPPVALDATDADAEPPGTLQAVISMNVIHIAPIAVCEGIMRLAGRRLAADGRLILYGPFKRDGQHTAPSNEAFDAMLREQNREWGVRDLGEVEQVAEGRGLRIVEIVEMPANNLVVIFRRAAD